MQELKAIRTSDEEVALKVDHPCGAEWMLLEGNELSSENHESPFTLPYVRKGWTGLTCEGLMN